MRKLALALGILCCLTVAANAASVVVVGNHLLQPNTPNQSIDIFVSGDDQALGLVLVTQTGDGQGGAPLITGVDVITGTIFGANNTGNQETVPGPGYQTMYGTTTVSGFVTTNGKLATLTFDTTGVAPGDYALILSFIPDWEVGTDWAIEGFGPLITDGILTVVPEPSSVLLGMFAAAGIGAVAIRNRRARKSA